jgi:hypothetical protein
MDIVLPKPKVSDFLALTKFEEVAPKALTRLKTVSISTRDVISVKGAESLCDIDLLRDVPIKDYRYVGVVGIVVSGEWLIPNCVRGGVSISFLDKRLTNSKEAIIGTYRGAVKDKRFQFKLTPNYFITAVDAARKPWQAFVRLQGIRIEDDWQPLALEVVSVAMCANNVVTKGLREKIIAQEDPNVEGFEGVVDEFVDSVPASKAIEKFKSKRRNYVGKDKVVVRKNRHRPEKFADLDSFDDSDEDAVHSDHSKPISVLRNGMGGARDVA